jgi:SAM-dependent methyltransferase
MAPSAPIRPSIALAAFAEKFIEGRRVLVFGNALSSFWEQLIERGARLVHVCDGDASRVAEAAARNTSQNVSFAPLGGAGLAVRDGAFDVGFIDNLAAFSDATQTVHKLKRALSPRGIALVSAPNPDLEHPLIGATLESGQKLDYYSLYDVVHREFQVVRMVGQMPFVGYSVAELAPAEDPDPCLDAGFVPGGTEEPEWFVAVASHADVEIDPFLVVQLPCDTLLKNGAERMLREQLRTARSAERSAVERLARLEAEQRKLSEAAERHQKDVDLARQLRLLQEELERKESWILQLEARAATADARADEADQELEELRGSLGSRGPGPNVPDAEHRIEAAESRIKDAEARVARAEEERRSLQAQLEQSLQELATTKQRLLDAELSHSSAVTKLSELERARLAQDTELQSRSTELRSVGVEKSELAAQLLASRSELATQLLASRAELEAQLLASRAEREATETSLRDARGRVVELEKRLADLEKRLGEGDPALESELARLEAQLAERGERVRKLESELAKTERIGTQLLRELGRARSATGAERASTATGQPQSALAPSNDVAPMPAPAPQGAAASSPQDEDALVVTATKEAWTSGPTVTTTPSTEQSPNAVSAWGSLSTTPDGSPVPATAPERDAAETGSEVSALGGAVKEASTEEQILRQKLDRLAAIAARQQADLSASQWRLEQSEAENEALRGCASENEALNAELVALRARLQEAEVLLAQLRWREATTSDMGPAR